MHEDNETLGIMSWHEYNWTSPAKGMMFAGTFVASVGAVLGAIYSLYPDMPAYPREFDGGLVHALGGTGAVRVCPPV